MSSKNDFKKPMDLIIWIGLIHIKPEKKGSILGKARGAFVNMLGAFKDEINFITAILELCAKHSLSITEISDVELFKKRKEHFTVSEDLIKLEESIQYGEVKFGTFHTF